VLSSKHAARLFSWVDPIAAFFRGARDELKAMAAFGARTAQVPALLLRMGARSAGVRDEAAPSVAENRAATL
jgi:hypothetical protein